MSVSECVSTLAMASVGDFLAAKATTLAKGPTTNSLFTTPMNDVECCGRGDSKRT